MDTILTIDHNFDVDSRNSSGTSEIKDRGGSFFMVGDSRMAIYETEAATQLRYWNEKTTAWESTWDDVSLPRGAKFLRSVDSRRALMGEVDPVLAGIVEVHPIHISGIAVDGSMQITKQPLLRFHTPILSVHFSFDTDYLFALSSTHVYYWNSDTPSTPPVRECPLHDDYRGVPLFARGSSLFFLYDGNAETMDEFDGSNGEWARWTIGHNYDGLLPNLSGLRGDRCLAVFTPEVITVFAVSIADNSLWSLDVYDLFWKRLGDLTQAAHAEIVAADGRTVFVRAGEETMAVTVVPLQEEEEVVEQEMEEEDEELKQLRAQLEEARAKRASQLSKLRKIGVMLLQAGADKKILDGIESGLEGRFEIAEEGEDRREKMRREMESIEKSEPLYKKKLMKYMAMISQSAKKEKEKVEESTQENAVEEEKKFDESKETEEENKESKMDEIAVDQTKDQAMVDKTTDKNTVDQPAGVSA